MDSSLLNTIRTRPRFVYTSHLSKEEYIQLLKDYFLKKNKVIGGYITDEICFFRIRSAKESIWNPCLQLKVEEDPYDQLTYVRGLFGPKPSVWTLFSFLYFGSIVLGVMSFCFYIASFSFGTWNIMLYLGLFFSLVVLSLFITSKIGQISTRNQMRLLKTFILMVIKDEQRVQKRRAEVLKGSTL